MIVFQLGSWTIQQLNGVLKIFIISAAGPIAKILEKEATVGSA
jgi:hypothetical protein